MTNTPLNKEVEELVGLFMIDVAYQAREQAVDNLQQIKDRFITALNDHYTQLFLEMVGDDEYDFSVDFVDRNNFKAELRNKIKELKEG